MQPGLALASQPLENRSLLAADANLIAYRPMTNHIDFRSYPVPDALEADVTRGAGHRRQ